jgi:hypothetical protein
MIGSAAADRTFFSRSIGFIWVPGILRRLADGWAH